MQTVEQAGKRPHILLVEGNTGDADAMRAAMRVLEAPADLAVVPNGYAALDYLQCQQPFKAAPRPDLVLLELNLPGLHGRQVLTSIKGNDALKGIPVLVLSSVWAPEIVDDCRKIADGYIVKPKTWAECVEVVRVVLRQLGRRDDLAASASFA